MKFDILNTEFNLELSGNELAHLNNAISYYLGCADCLENYEDLKQYIKSEQVYLNILYEWCTMLKSTEYFNLIEKVTKYYEKN